MIILIAEVEKLGRNIIYCLLWATLIFLYVMPQQAEAQSRRHRYQQRFKAGLILGGNLSQVDGDGYHGFHKSNLQFGISGTAILNEHSEIGVEFIYAGRGCKVASERSSGLAKRDRLIDLRYMEVPILFRYRPSPEAPSSSLIEAGISFGRIISSRVIEPIAPGDGNTFRDFEPYFDSSEVTLLAGGGYQISRRLNFKLRFGFALTQFYRNPAIKEKQPVNSFLAAASSNSIAFMRNYYLALMAHYQF
ncbi:MAG: PorT family protein [Lewinellaceae bacterium]|nr:PorT family protein [Phaeodactylibacter sp.]MCB0612490.1 PorT family protein [Phaeodactylibacter sp.]MCB9351446.1 PorT family protein [Lewinellaceae bacterium]